MTIIFGEQPPHDVEDKLKEWLARFTTQANIFAEGQTANGGGPANDPHLFMRWAGNFVSGDYYRVGDVVFDEGYTMICVGDTYDKAAPQPSGQATWSLPPMPAWTKPTDNSTVQSGHTYTMLQTGWLQGIRVWAPAITADIEYRFILIRELTGDIEIYETPPLNLDDWTVMQVFNAIALEGEDITLILESINAGGTTPVTGSWRYDGSVQNPAPVSGGWEISNQNTVLGISDTDLNTTDRTAELMGMIVNTTIQFAVTATPSDFITYRVTAAPTDQGNFIQYDVVVIDQGGSVAPGDTTTMTAAVPIAQPTEYVELAGNWPAGNPAWADVNGVLRYDSIDQPGNENDAFGIDFLFQQAILSPNWEIVSFP